MQADWFTGRSREEVRQILDALRTEIYDTVVLPPSEHWKLRVWALQNPGLVAKGDAAEAA